jgi:SET and MYND domain-containing protein
LLKSRLGRALHFTTINAVAAGEELCISYVDVTTDIADVAQVAEVKNADVNTGGDGRVRRKKLQEQWFFNCGCERCSREKLRPVS